MSDESLVPTGQPYGTREDTKGLMRMAGLPLGASPQVAGAPVSSPPPPSGGGGPGLDLLAGRKPTMQYGQAGPMPSPLERLRMRVEGSQNLVLKDIVARLSGGTE